MKKTVLLFIFLTFLFLGSKAQNFTNIDAGFPGVRYSASSAWGDYDNDGLLDIVICGEPTLGIDTTLLYHNDGDDNFTLNTSVDLVNVSLGDVEWGDFNNDDDLDLIVMGYSNDLGLCKLYLNNGDGSFTEQASTGLPDVYMGDIDFADYNNDGFLDVGICGFDNNYVFITKVFENNQDLTFTEVSGLNLEGMDLGKFKWGDYNNDGYPDFVMNGYGDVDFVTRLYKNNGDGSFSEQTSVNLHQGWLGDMAWADYDGDGDLDLTISGVGGDGSQRYTLIYSNNGDETFTEENGMFLPAVSHSSLEWADFDGDGDLDLFIAGTVDAMGTGNYVGEIRYNNDGNFSESEEILKTYWGDCRAADYNNDGYADLFICGYDTEEFGVAEIFRNDKSVFVNNQAQDFSKVWPQPAQDFIRLQSTSLIRSYQILNMEGQIVKEGEVNEKYGRLNVADLQNGSYLLQLMTKAGMETQKIMITK